VHRLLRRVLEAYASQCSGGIGDTKRGE
jgi:hypothetical protein